MSLEVSNKKLKDKYYFLILILFLPTSDRNQVFVAVTFVKHTWH